MDKISIVGNLSPPMSHECHEHKNTLHFIRLKKKKKNTIEIDSPRILDHVIHLTM